MAPSAQLSDAEIAQYHEEGYVAVEGVYPPEFVEELCRVTDAFVEGSREVRAHTDVYDIDPRHTAEQPLVRRIKQPADQHETYRRALEWAPMLDRVAQLIGPDLRFQNTKLNMKSAEHGAPVEWHQDLAGYPHTNEDILAVGLALDDMTVENGCLMVIPRSHKGPVFSHHDDGTYVAAITDPAFSAETAVPLQVKAGGITIHHGRMVHGSRPNLSNRPRRLLLMELRANDAWPLVGIRDWESFNAQILRGAPCFAPRMEAVPLRVPYPPPPTVGSIYEGQSHLKDKRHALR